MKTEFPPAASPHSSWAGCSMDESSEWSVLVPSQVRELDAAKVSRRYGAGERVYMQGGPCQGMYCIESGRVSVRQTDDEGNVLILRSVKAGQTLGYADFLAGRNHRESAMCSTNSTICHVPDGPLHKVLQENPALSLAFLTLCAKDILDTDLERLSRGLVPVRVRLAGLLLKHTRLDGASDGNGGWYVSLPITWHEAAEMVGANAESVYRALHSLEEEDIVRVQQRTVHIRDIETLASLI